jgi:hypothetical protein
VTKRYRLAGSPNEVRRAVSQNRGTDRRLLDDEVPTRAAGPPPSFAERALESGVHNNRTASHDDRQCTAAQMACYVLVGPCPDAHRRPSL